MTDGFMTYDDALAFFHSFDRFGIQPGLSRMEMLLDFLYHPEKRLRYIHVAGTNGKGTTCSMLSEIFRDAGYRVGLYTSPYVLCFRERIQINGEMISESDLAAVAAEVRAGVGFCNREGVFPTEFEVVTAAAFVYFAKKRCNLVVLETGLGGRLDATNVIERPEVSVITSVSLDHMDVLGAAPEAIAREKAGIIKRCSVAVTSSRQSPAVQAVLQSEANARPACLLFANDEAFKVVSASLAGTDVLWDGRPLHIPFPGAHQLENASLAVLTAQTAANLGWRISPENIVRGIAKARLPARTELLSRAPLVLLDGSHNDGSTRALADVLEAFLPKKRILAVMGLLADKELARVLDNLLPAFAEVIAVTPPNPRALAAEALAEEIAGRGVPACAIPQPQDGIDKAFRRISTFDALVVCGSLYLASDVREKLNHLLTSPAKYCKI